MKKAYNRRKFAAKTSKCRDFTQILNIFVPSSYNERNIIVKPSQRGYFAMILREKKSAKIERGRVRVLVHRTSIYADIPSFFGFFRAKSSSLFVGDANQYLGGFPVECDCTRNVIVRLYPRRIGRKRYLGNKWKRIRMIGLVIEETFFSET